MAGHQADKADDLDLVKRAQAGDRRAFDLLVVKYYSRVNRLLFRFVHRAEEAEDLAQDTFIKAYRALPNFRSESSFYTWLYRIAINTAKNYFSSQKRQAPLLSDLTGDDSVEPAEMVSMLRDIGTPEHLLMTKEIVQTVSDAIDALPEELKMAISLRELEGLSYEEIAEAMSCPVGTVRSRIFRAREAVAQRLKPIVDTPKGRRW